MGNLIESSDLSFGGSCEHDLLISKLWLCRHLPKQHYNKVYVLGSWYGNMGFLLNYAGVDYDKIINVDSNPGYCSANETLYKLAGFDQPYEIICKDCNHLNYDDADLVINTSTNDIKSSDWLDSVPVGRVVAAQCRNNQSDHPDKARPDSFQEFLNDYRSLNHVLYHGKLALNNNEESYLRYMIIGTR